MIVTIHQSNCPTSKKIWIWILANQKISFYSARSCSICHLELFSNQKATFYLPSCIFVQSEMTCPPSPLPLPLHRTLTSTLLWYLVLIIGITLRFSILNWHLDMSRHNIVFACIHYSKSLLTNQNNGMSSYLINSLINC